MIKSLTLIFSLVLFSPSVFAEEAGCYGVKNNIEVSFATDPSADGAVVIKRNINDQTKDELLDDTGYISAALLRSYLVKNAEGNTITQTKSGSEMRLMRVRLKKMKSVLEESKVQSSEVNSRLEKLDKLLNNLSVDAKELNSAWNGLDDALRSENITVNAKSRKPGQSQWSDKEEPVGNFTMPPSSPIRGLSCVPSVTKVSGESSLENSKSASGTLSGGSSKSAGSK